MSNHPTPTGTECGACARPAPDTTICPSCTAQIVSELRRIPWLVEQLNITLTRQARTGDRNGPRTSERPLPYDADASVDLDTLHGTLTVWCREIADRRHLTPPTGDSAALAGWLTLWPSEIAAHPDAADLHDQILSAIRAGERTVDRRPDRKFVGPCDGYGATVLPDDGHHGCGEDLYAHLNAKTITCRTPDCHAVYDVEQRRAWLLEAAIDQLRTARQLSDELPWIAGVSITSKVIGMWSSRGKITIYGPHPSDPRRAQRFRVGDVIDQARRMQEQRHAATAGAA